MFRGLDDGLVGDLWNFPSALGVSGAKALAKLRKKLRAALGMPISLARPLHRLYHNITYRSIEVQIYRGELSEKPQGRGFRCFPVGKIERAAVSQLARKIARELFPSGDNASSKPR